MFMVLLAESPRIAGVRAKAGYRPAADSHSAVPQKRLTLVSHDDPPHHAEWEFLEKLRESLCASGGQFISLNVQDFGEATLPGILCSALESSQTTQYFRINLPIILQNNPNTESPFINRAILWQRLCNRIIKDEDGLRPTILVLENIDQATRKTQHDTARLIRFHLTHRIHRNFLLTLHRNNVSLLESELGQLMTDTLDVD
jgi:hypothetical protein